MWNVINDVIKPREGTKWTLKEEEKIIEDEKEIAETFNKFFVEKIANLKKNIEDLKKDPLEKLKKRMAGKNLKFSLRQVTENQVKKAIESLKKKKSSGLDGVSQECVVMGAEVLVVPLMRIINCSIENGQFPKEWKEELVTPILKKGDPKDKRN